MRFLDEIKAGGLPTGQIPMRLAERILPIAQRLEREESAAKGEEIARAAREEARRRVEEALVRPGEPAEVVLTADERDFGLSLENLAELEKQLKPLDASELQAYFMGLRTIFSKFPSDSRMRAEVMRNVNNQLGAEAERLKKAGKSETEIFDEWLKRVFIPLYKRTKKKL